MKNSYLILSILCYSTISWGQMNDTITFKTGYDKVVEIDSFTTSVIYYRYRNKKLNKVKNYTESIKKIKRFVTYDEEGVKTYDSHLDYEGDQPKVKVDSIKVAEHDLSVNPFMIALLSPSVRYTYKFGNYMEWGINTRFTYLNPLIFEDISSTGVLMLGVGPRYMPYYSRKFGFGIDFTPMWLLGEGESVILLPMGFDFDFFFGNTFGLAIDFGVGYAFAIQDGYTGFGGRGNIGFLMRLGNKYNVPNASSGVK